MQQWEDDGQMTFRLIDGGWEDEFREALRTDSSELRIICPFIKEKPIRMLLEHQPKHVEVITRFNLGDCADGVSDVAALRRLLEADARVRGVRNLHAKLYLFGKRTAVITSCNLTVAALSRNQEIGLVTTDDLIVKKCQEYFDRLWNAAGADLKPCKVSSWEKIVEEYRLGGGRPQIKRGLKDFGVEAESAESPPFVASGLKTPESQAIVKFLGSDKNRRSPSVSTMEIIEEEGCHWAVSYRRNRRPRIVQDGDTIFLGRLTRDPKDIRIFGRATAMAYKEGRDDATEADIDRRGWMSDFPHFARVYNAEFFDGPIENGVSLYELMDELETDSYEVTQENRDSGTGNTSARMAIRRQTQMRLSLEGYSWLRERLAEAFDKHGKVPRTALEKLDWPDASGNSTLQT